MERKKADKSIANATKLFTEVMGKSVTNEEFKKLSRKYQVRDGLLKYAHLRGFCYKSDNKYYEFYKSNHIANFNHKVAKILEDRAEYLKECKAKRDFQKTLKEESPIDKKQDKKQDKSHTILNRNSLYDITTIKGKNLHITDLTALVVSLKKELKTIDKECINYLDEIDLLKERIAKLEKEKDEVRTLFYKVGFETLKTYSEQKIIKT